MTIKVGTPVKMVRGKIAYYGIVRGLANRLCFVIWISETGNRLVSDWLVSVDSCQESTFALVKRSVLRYCRLRHNKERLPCSRCKMLLAS